MYYLRNIKKGKSRDELGLGICEYQWLKLKHNYGDKVAWSVFIGGCLALAGAGYYGVN